MPTFTSLIRDTLLGAIDNGSIERNNVAQLVVGPSRDRQTLLLWSSDEWEDYGEYEDDDAFAELSNAAWLDRVDALVNGDLPAVETREPTGYRTRLPDLDLGSDAFIALWKALRVGIQDALRELAASGELGELQKIVGLMEYGMSVSDHADLVAFVHPLGTGELWPIHESRAGGIDIYTFGALHDEGITMFYPEGQQDCLSGEDGEASWHTFAFADLESWHATEDDVFLRMRGDLHDIRMTSGHRHDEWGGPNSDEICAALRAHLNRHRSLLFDPARMPDPHDETALERWFTSYRQQNCSNGYRVVRRAFDELGEVAARAFIERQSPDAEDRSDALAALAGRLFADRQFGQALELIQQLEGQPRLDEWREEMQSLLLLERWREALERAEAIAAAESGERASDVLPFRAMALSGLERRAEASALLRAVAEENRDATYAFAEAFVFRHLDVARAQEALVRALQESASAAELGPLCFEDSPEVFALLEQRARLEQQRESHDARIAEIRQCVAPEVHGLDVVDAATAGLSSSPEGEAERWRAVAKLDRDENAKGSYQKLILDPHEITWVPTQTGGFTGFDLRDSGQPQLVHTFASDTSLADACRAGRWLFAADCRRGLAVIDLDARAVVAHSTRLWNDSTKAIAMGDGFVAVMGSYGAELYDITTPAAPVLQSTVGCGHSRIESAPGEDVAISGNTLFMAAGHAGLVVADVSDPRRPEILAALCRKDFWAGTIDLLGNLAILTHSHEAWFVDVTDPARPQSLCVLGDPNGQPEITAFAANPAGERLMGCDDSVPVIWSIELDDRGCPTTLVAHATANTEGSPERIYYTQDAALLPDGRLAVLTRDALVILERESIGSTGDVTALIHAAEPTLRQWVVERLEEHARDHADTPIGVLILSLTFADLEMGLEPARSIAGIEVGPIRETEQDREPEIYEASLSDLVELPPTDDTVDPLGLLERRRARAWTATLEAVLRSLRDESILRDQAAGRIYLVRRSYDARRDRYAIKVVDVLTDPTKPWQPYRRGVVLRGPKTVAEKLDEATRLDRFCQQAREDEAFRREILAVARQGHTRALRVAWSVRDADESAVVETLLAVAESSSVDVFVIRSLARFVDRPEVLGVLERIFEDPPQERYPPHPASLQIAAAAALGRASDDRIIAVIRGLLDDTDGTYEHADLAIKAMDAMDTRHHELLTSLRGWIERADERDNRLPGICRQLFRAGHRELPQKLLLQSRREKRGEQYASVKLGLKGLGDERFQEPACASERLFTSRMLVDRAAKLEKCGDSESSVWPPELPPEPWPASWEFVLEGALPVLKLYGELDGFVDRLAAHAVAGEHYAADRALLLGMANYYENTNQHGAWRRIAEIILAAANVFEIGTVRRIRDRNRRLRLQDGWHLLEARDLAAARAIAEQAVADEPNDGQVLFFDARLCWLEHDAPEAGIERAKTHLEMLGNDPLGRGRLLNLIGCALDELGQIDDALPYFERAAQAHPDEPMYLANIAECCDKLGRAEPALLWAERALERGADSEVCRRIVAAHETRA